MFHYDYQTEATCFQIVSLDLDENIVHNLAKAVQAAYEAEESA